MMSDATEDDKALLEVTVSKIKKSKVRVSPALRWCRVGSGLQKGLSPGGSRAGGARSKPLPITLALRPWPWPWLSQVLEGNVQSDNAALRKELADITAKGDSLATSITKLAR